MIVLEETGRALLERLLALMNVEAQVHAEEHQGGLRLEVAGQDAGLLIGRRGQNLEALQFLVGRILERQVGERTRVFVDVGGYQERRRQQLEERAFRLAKQVKATGESVMLEPMAAVERRIIHLALEADGDVRTESTGSGRERRLLIKPKSL